MTIQIGILPDDVIHSIQAGLEGNGRVDNGSFIRLPHPRTGLPALFLPHQSQTNSSISELQAIEPVNSRSWFIENEVVADGKLLMITPVDPAFLLIPILRSFAPKDGSLGQFRTCDDIFEEVASKMEQNTTKDASQTILAKDVATFASLDCCMDALTRICDVQDIPPDIKVYRFSPTKLTEYLRLKVQNLTESGVIDKSRMLVRYLARDGLMEDGNEKLLEAGHKKAACDLIAQYLPPDICDMLVASYDFTDLTAHLDKLEEEKRLKAQQAVSSSTKRKVKAEASTEKADKRKAPKASQGVEKLKKANINGMSKLSTFFTKKA